MVKWQSILYVWSTWGCSMQKLYLAYPVGCVLHFAVCTMGRAGLSPPSAASSIKPLTLLFQGGSWISPQATYNSPPHTHTYSLTHTLSSLKFGLITILSSVPLCNDYSSVTAGLCRYVHWFAQRTCCHALGSLQKYHFFHENFECHI